MAADLRKPERSYSIRQLRQEFGVTARALRFYEDKGLLSPQRLGQTRVYHGRERARLQLIVRGKRVGLSLAELREMLDLYDENDGGAVQMAHSLGKFRERIIMLKAQRDDIEAALAQLEEGVAGLEQRLAAIRPDLLPQAEDYEAMIRARLGDPHDVYDKPPFPKSLGPNSSGIGRRRTA